MHTFSATVLDGFKTHGVGVVVKNDLVVASYAIASVVGEMEDAVYISVGATDEGLPVHESLETIAGFKYHGGHVSFRRGPRLPPAG
jgi:hypothetical protein